MVQRPILYTIGHSTRPTRDLIELLRSHGVEQVVDVRAIPRSRHNPQFNRPALSRSLHAVKIGYRHLKALGGLRRARPDSINLGWRNASFRGFADYMQTAGFAAGLARLEQLAARRPTVIMCAEAVPWRCHRSLIADALTVARWRVLHIQSRRTVRPHRRTPFLEVRSGRLLYPGDSPGRPVGRELVDTRPLRADSRTHRRGLYTTQAAATSFRLRRICIVGGTVRVLTIRGIPINVHVSWLVIYGLITWTLAVGYFPRALPDLPAAAYWANGLLAAFLLFVSVLLHELSHSFVAVAHGLSVRGITLHVFGGVSHLEDEPPSPRAEFLIAVVGPITSFAIAAVLWVIGAAGLVRPAWAQAVITYLVLVNIAVGVFNLVPGFPLDGGRLLRAVLWKWKGTLGQATYIASRVGVGFAFVLMALGVWQILSGAVIGGFWFILIGTFLRGAADASYSQMALREALARLPVRDIMTRDVVTVSPEATVAQLADAFWSHHVTSFPVVDGGTVRGIASVQQVHEVPPEQRMQRRVSDLMRALTDDLVVGPDDSVFDALGKASRNKVGRLAVLNDSRLVGYLSLKDITHVLALRGLPEGARSAPGAVASASGPGRRAA